MTSVTSGGALIGALFAGIPADRYGRKLGIYIGCFLFLAGTVIQASAFSVPQMTVGRFVVGVGVGSAAMIVVSMLFITISQKVLKRSFDIAPLHRRTCTGKVPRANDCIQQHVRDPRSTRLLWPWSRLHRGHTWMAILGCSWRHSSHCSFVSAPILPRNTPPTNLPFQN